MEILFAPKTAFTLMSEVFEDIKTHRYSLINSTVLKSSLKGYVFSEIRLATGERTGQLGGKRKSALTKYGFSPKNFVQVLRLCKVGIEFFKDGQYMVNVAEFDPVYHNFLMEIKTQPENFTCEQLRQIVNVQYNKLEKAMDESKIVFEFDTNLASDIVHCARKLYES